MMLKAYQAAGAEYLRANSKACLFDEMGLGKTAQALTALPNIWTGPSGDLPRALVVCPAIAKTVWEDEAAKWRSDLRVKILSGRGSFRWPDRGELVVLNYELLPAKPTEAPGRVHLIADEGHYLKTAKTRRTRLFRLLAKSVQEAAGAVWILTGSPMIKDPPDLWNVLASAGLAYRTFGTWPRFREAFNAVDTEVRVRGGGRRVVTVWGQAQPWVKASLREVALRRTRAEVLDELPGKIRSVVRVPVVDATAKRLADEALGAVGAIRGIDLEAAFERAIDAGGTAFEKIAATRCALATLKVQACAELLESYRDAGRPVVVFSAHRAPVEFLGSRPGWSAVLGGDDHPTRAKAVENFQGGLLEGLALTIGAGGTAITLTRSADVIFVDQSWSPTENLQAEDRLCRIGQRQAVQVVVLEADHPVDAMVNRVMARKMRVAESAGV